MDYILNIKQESENIDIQNQPSVNIDIQEESIAINKTSDNFSLNVEQAPNVDLNIEQTPDYVLNFDGPVIEIDGNYAEAMQAVQLAKDWAIKTDGAVDGVDYSSKYYAQQIIPIASDIATVSGIASDITAVSGIASDISTVSGIASDISSVAGDLTNIDAVAGDLSNIDSVASDLTNIDAVNSNKTNIDTVAGISSDINTVAGISSDITSVAGNNSNITAVANNETDISAVASDLTNINAVAGDLANIDNASSYAAEAKQWAIGDPTEPTGNSAKYWADEAAATLADKQDKLTVGTGIDITSNVISVTLPALINTATYPTDSIALITASTNSAHNAVAVGYNSIARDYGGVAIGTHAKSYNNGASVGGSAEATGSKSVAIGYSAKAQSSYSIQIGQGTNTEVNSLYVGTSSSNNYKMLDDTGLIPDARISSNIARTSAIPTVDQTYDGTSSNAQSGVAIEGELSNYVQSSTLATVATSGNYADLSGKPNYGAGLSYSSSSLQLLDQNGNNLGSAVTIKSTPDLDGVTIDTNSDDELEAIGTINKNTAVGATAVKYDWIGTLAEYNAQNVETLHPEWVCYITDDVSGGASVYTKAEVDSAISTALTTMLDSAFPVGSRYITEASTCPLATLIPNSTWVLTSQGRVIQGADSNHASGTTAEAGLPNITGRVTPRPLNSASGAGTITSASGAFSLSQKTGEITSSMSIASTNYGSDVLTFDASQSSSIYGNSTTVQPPAEFVNIFKRTA